MLQRIQNVNLVFKLLSNRYQPQPIAIQVSERIHEHLQQLPINTDTQWCVPLASIRRDSTLN